MGRIRLFFSVCCLIAWPWIGCVCGTTNGEQRFTFLARSKGSCPVFWIAEDVAGQYNQSHLLQVVLNGPKPSLISSDLDYQKDWTWFKESLRLFQTEEPIRLTRQDDRWKPADAAWTVQRPDPNEKWTTLFTEHVRQGGSGAEDWNRKRGLAGIVLPGLGGIKTQCVYYYPRGLYVNYEIGNVYYFPKTGYVLVFTIQSRRAVGLDTMHGFLLLRRVG